jgi:hypothetical protein
MHCYPAKGDIDMDDKRFDLLTKSLSGGISRRSLLRSLAAGIGVAAIGVERAVAAPGGVNGGKKCYGGGSQCTNAKQCCSGTCTNRVCAPEGGGDPCATMNCADANPCTTGGCAAGQCTYTPVAAGTACAGGFCNSAATCVPAICTPASSEACYSGPAGTDGKGICKAGTRTCDATGQWGSCTGEILPTAEICGNGLDDDCDGVADGGCPGTECVLPQDCEGQDTECRKITCDNGFCGTFNLAGDHSLVHQAAGDCQRNVCDGNGGETTTPDDLDLPLDDGNECTANLCSMGAPVYPAMPLGTACGESGLGLQCDLKGQCRAGVCTLGTVEACYTGAEGTLGVGVCASGTRTCSSTAEWGPCIGEILPSTEV